MAAVFDKDGEYKRKYLESKQNEQEKDTENIANETENEPTDENTDEEKDNDKNDDWSGTYRTILDFRQMKIYMKFIFVLKKKRISARTYDQEINERFTNK